MAGRVFAGFGALAARPNDYEIDCIAASHERCHRLRLVEFRHESLELLRARDLVVLEREKHVRFADAGTGRRTLDAFDSNAILDLQLALLRLGVVCQGQGMAALS